MAKESKIRTPIVCVMGHVDHGKTSLLDRIRGSSVVSTEAGAITQHIGATLVPIDAIVRMSGALSKVNVNVPGLLFIDTPGHHAFTTLRARGGALADMAIVVVDINEGFRPQTIEALQILRNYRTPFVIAANKIDRIHGWRVNEGQPFLKTFAQQNERVQGMLETKVYELVGKLSELGFNSERFDRVSDFARNICIVPISALTGEGVPDILMVLIGLAQRYMTESLRVSADGPGAGTVLEVKEERGLGMTLDVILYDGTLKVGDEIVVAGNDQIIETKVRSLLQPRPMKEILIEERFERVKSITAAAGIKVAAPKLEGVIAGSPLRVIRGGNRDEVVEQVRHEIQDIQVNLSDIGVIIRADTIGALEALSKELEGHQIQVMRAAVGPVTRHDVIEAGTIKDPLYSAIIAFNTPVLPDAIDMLADASMSHVSIFEGGVIYQLIDDYVEWREEKKQELERQRFEKLVMPAKIRILPNCVFRQSNPAVVGVRVLGGKLQSGVDLVLSNGRNIGRLKQIQAKNESILEAEAGMEVAISIEGPTVGRQINVDDDLYVDVPERHVKVIEREMINQLNPSTREVFEEFTALKRREDPFWGK
ncbi:translation initiation factor IF-2 [Methanoculleus thermophilus]|jgi:translation initiation factor 5B|uniref:Probable translation initiation factor IF-2 n=1 Tax=Methanoculleus thermophilus TaxID=2200 RepID=A0A1G8ZDI4_9EURY|nr:translation initiation factor IF-2 [Methanoculleus thermophilus]SDK13172.1 translation initiation factor eaIF-5B [Methanoculleus thermophilus]